MEIDSDEPRPHTQPQRRGVVDIVVATFLVLIGIIFLSYSLQSDRKAEEVSRQFMAAPLCGSRAVDLANCRLNTPMMVTDKWVHYGSKGRRYYYLDLRTYTGDTYETRVIGRSPFWNAAVTGQIVGTQRWHDDVVSMSAGSMSAITSAYPGPRRGEIHYFFSGMAGALLAGFVSFFVFVCIKAAQGQ